MSLVPIGGAAVDLDFLLELFDRVITNLFSVGLIIERVRRAESKAPGLELIDAVDQLDKVIHDIRRAVLTVGPISVLDAARENLQRAQESIDHLASEAGELAVIEASRAVRQALVYLTEPTS